jgi:hypothetical protein
MQSAKESSSLPMAEDTWSRRAAKPSKKSNVAPRMMNANATLKFPLRAYCVATQPHTRLQQVMVLGMCFFMIQMQKIMKMDE